MLLWAQIRDRYRYRPFINFITSCCAIVGGVLTSLGIVNRLLGWVFCSICGRGGDQLSPKANRGTVQ